MMTETARERIYREALEEIKFNGDVALDEQNLNREPTYQTSAGKQFDIARLALTKGDKLPDSSVSTDNLKDYLSVYKDDVIQKIRDEKMQLVTAYEFQHENAEKLKTLRELEKVKKQRDTTVEALTEIRADIAEHNQIYDLGANTALLLEGIDGIAFEALAALEGGEDE